MKRFFKHFGERGFKFEVFVLEGMMETKPVGVKAETSQ